MSREITAQQVHGTPLRRATRGVFGLMSAQFTVIMLLLAETEAGTSISGYVASECWFCLSYQALWPSGKRGSPRGLWAWCTLLLNCGRFGLSTLRLSRLVGGEAGGTSPVGKLLLYCLDAPVDAASLLQWATIAVAVV